jgi:hypothetical protein
MTKIQWRIVILTATSMAWLFIAACGGSAIADGSSTSTGLNTTPFLQVSESTSGSGYSVPVASVPDGESRLYVKYEGVEGSGIPIRNGGLIHLPGGIDAEIFVDPYPTDSLTAWLDLYLERDGLPVTDAEALILYDMWSMGHGPYTGQSEAATDGHYVFRLDYVMFGAWEQVLEVRTPGVDEVASLGVIIVAVP